MTDPVQEFIDVASTRERCFWLDGGGSRPWSGRRSIIGWLDDDDLSLTYDARTREVRRHVSGRSEVVGDDIFRALEEARADDHPDAHWVGYFGYASRPDLPAALDPDDPMPTAVWMRTRNVRIFEHDDAVGERGGFETVAERPPQPKGFETVAGAPSSTTGEVGSGGFEPFETVAARPPQEPTVAERPPQPKGFEPFEPFEPFETVAARPPQEPTVAARPPHEPTVAGAPSSTTGEAGVEVPPDYAAEFARVQEQLHAGNSYEVNLTHRLVIDSDVDPVTAYLRLREANPAPYAGFLSHLGCCLLSSSPERFATIDRDGTIETKPIKGTTPRGSTRDDDERLRHHLATDPKFRAENLMIVDLLRNDLAMVCEPGSVEVPVLMDVESYASVHQLVSTVRGRLRDDVSTIGALRALFPAGSMTGAPKLRTMEIIDEVEATPRGVYAGAFGWLSGDRADLGVVIRSLSAAGDGVWRLGTGGGITVRSDVVEEYAESLWKAERLRQVLD